MMRLNSISLGDIIDVVAPASACALKELNGGVKALRQMGYEPRVPENIFAKSVLFSNSDEERLKQLKRAIYAEDSHIIWCLRGGYGAIRLLPEMRKWKKPKRPKIFIGYSDITTLHVFLNQEWGWPTLHGPMVSRLGRGPLTPTDHKELFGLLHGTKTEIEFTGLEPLNAEARKKKRIEAPVRGGNMAVLQSGLGTPGSLKTKGAILFFEDLSERPHRVDRMLTQFTQAGWFQDCQAVLLGDFLLEPARDHRHLWNDVFQRFSKDVRIPLLRGMPVGHDPKRNRPLPFNTSAVLELGPKPKITVQSGIKAK